MQHEKEQYPSFQETNQIQVKESAELIYGILWESLYSYELYKQLRPYFETRQAACDPLEIEFWRHISDNCIQMASIQWNKVFGSDNGGGNITHFSHLVSQCELKKSLEKKEKDFKSIVDKMKQFRDKYVAHKDKIMFEVPSFSDAMVMIYQFDDLVREKYKEEWVECLGPSLKDTQESYRDYIIDYLAAKGLQPCRVDDHSAAL